jgi:hypothetical protein
MLGFQRMPTFNKPGERATGSIDLPCSSPRYGECPPSDYATFGVNRFRFVSQKDMTLFRTFVFAVGQSNGVVVQSFQGRNASAEAASV